MKEHFAPGWPGIPARWTSSAKTGVGTALSNCSRVWFTISHGILNEIYYPSIDKACTRDVGLIITSGEDFFSEEKRDAEHQVEWIKRRSAYFQAHQYLPRAPIQNHQGSSGRPRSGCCPSKGLI